MPKFPSIPRLSIIVPIGRSLAAFEGTLISVLENQPPGCEILVASDGSYNDPHELCDEVRFVVGDSSHMVDLVAAGAAEARGRFVHVIAEGLRASCGWIDGALEKFEHFDAAVVAPVIRDVKSNKISAAGWCDAVDRLCKRAYSGRDRVNATASTLIGAYLPASFWRREVLRSMTNAYSAPDFVEASYAYDHLMRSAGWRCVLASDSELLSDRTELPWEYRSFARGRRLRAIRAHFSGDQRWSKSVIAASGALVSNVLKPGYLIEALGQAAAPLAMRQMEKQLCEEAVKPCNDANVILAMPSRGNQSMRRAA